MKELISKKNPFAKICFLTLLKQDELGPLSTAEKVDFLKFEKHLKNEE